MDSFKKELKGGRNEKLRPKEVSINGGNHVRKPSHSLEKEILLFQIAAMKIRRLGERMAFTEDTINTAILFVLKFHKYHSFYEHVIEHVAIAALFLAAKSIMDIRCPLLSDLLKRANAMFQTGGKYKLSDKSQDYENLRENVLCYENYLLVVLNFNVVLDIPHHHIRRICMFVHAKPQMICAALYLADICLCLTSLMLVYSAKEMACVCFYLACKFTDYEIGLSSEGKEWFYYIEKTMELHRLASMSNHYLDILEKMKKVSRKFKRTIIEERQRNCDPIAVKVKSQKWRLIPLDLPQVKRQKRKAETRDSASDPVSKMARKGNSQVCLWITMKSSNASV